MYHAVTIISNNDYFSVFVIKMITEYYYVMATPECVSEICAAAGVVFRGIQSPDPELKFLGLVLFDEPRGSTLAVPLPSVSVAEIKNRLASYEHAEFERQERITKC